MATAARTTRAGSRPRAKTRSGTSSRANGARRSSAARSTNSATTQNGAGTARSVAVPLLSATLGAAAGVAGGVALGRTALSPRRRVDFSQLAQQVGAAGRQFGKLASEVRSAREKAEQVGKVLS